MPAWKRTGRSGTSLFFGLLLMVLLLLPLPVHRAAAAPSLVQNTSANSTASTSINTAFNQTAGSGSLLVTICSINTAATISTPAGYTMAINESGDPAQAIFYKVSTGTESSATCSFSASGTAVIQIFEYSGMHGYTTVDAVSPGGSTGTTGTATTGNVVTTHASDVLVAAVVTDSSSNIPTSWTNSFTQRVGNTVGGKTSNRVGYGSADLTVSSTGTYSASVTLGSGLTWRGQLVAFKALQSSPALTFDFVDGSGASVASPSATLASVSPTFICQTVTGTIGSSTQKFRVANTTDNPAWTLALAATSGPTATWSAPTTPAHSYKFNDPAGAGCTNGQLTVDAAVGTLSAATNCSTSGVNKGSSTAFASGTTNAITILSAASPANIDCYWELTGVSLSQKIPAGQLGGNYTLNMTLTITAN